MKKIFSVMMVLLLAIGVMAGCTNTKMDGDDSSQAAANQLLYTLSPDSSYYSVSGVKDGVTDVVIPAEYNGKPVKEIKESTFKHQTSITSSIKSIVIPAGMEKIGENEFLGCADDTLIYVESATKPDGWSNYWNARCMVMWNYGGEKGVTDNGIGWAKDNNGEISVTGYNGDNDTPDIPSAINNMPVTKINERAFADNTQIRHITIPGNIVRIGNRAFYGCENLESLQVLDGVSTISEFAFAMCTNLTDMTMPNTITEIDEDAFFKSNKLMYVTLPVVVLDVIPTSQLREVIINGGEIIPIRAFQNCHDLSKVELPDTITKIKEWAFYDCPSLTNINIPSSVKTIEEYAFHSCRGLNTIFIPDSVTNLGHWAFYKCPNIRIRVQATSRPGGWDRSWNGNSAVIWGCNY